MTGEQDDLLSLRRGLHDLVTLTTLPALWANRQPRDIANSLAEFLSITVHLDLVYIRWNRASDAESLEVLRTDQGGLSPEHAQAVGQLLEPHLKRHRSNTTLSIPDPLDSGALIDVAVVPIEHETTNGVVVAGIKAPKFMTEIDHLLLAAAITQAITALQQLQLVSDLREANQVKDNLLLKEQMARTEAEAAQRRMRFLAEASAVLAASLDYETALTYVMRLAIPLIADWCSLILLDESGELHSINTITKESWIQECLTALQKKFPFEVKGSYPISQVISTGRSLLISQIDQEVLEKYASDPEHLTLMQQLKLKSTIAVALQARGQTLGALSFNFAGGVRHYTADDLALVEGLAHRISVAIDRAHLYEHERSAREILQGRVQLQAIISEIGQQALISDDVTEVMGTAVKLLTQTLGVEYSKILQLLPDKNQLFLRAGIGWREGLVGQMTIGAGLDSQSGYTLVASHPVIVEDLRTETRFHGPQLLLEHKVVSGMSVIIQGHERPWGVLGVHTTRRRTFTPDDIYFVQSIANILGAALERARWYEEAQKTATLQERQRIARELHDAVSQTLFAANLMAESLPQLWERQPDKAIERVRQLHQLTRGAAAEMRVLLIELRPESVISANLAYLITQLGYAMPGRQNIDISVHIRNWPEQPLPPDTQVTFYRIAQESLNNVIKHGQAKQARLRLVWRKNQAVLTITDNGRGFDMKRLGSGLGLKSMWERANSIGAFFNVRSRLGRGTQVRLVWPVLNEKKSSS